MPKIQLVARNVRAMQQTFRYGAETYQLHNLQSLTDRELRSEYSRLRSVAEKRLQRIGSTEFSESKVYQSNAGRYKKVKEIDSRREMEHLLSDLYDFLSAKRGSLQGLRENRAEVIESLHQSGHEWVNESNFFQFTRFMDFSRSVIGGRVLGSEKVAKYFADHRGQSDTQIRAAFQDAVKRGIV